MAGMHDLTNRDVINRQSASLLAALFTLSLLAGAPTAAIAAEPGGAGPSGGPSAGATTIPSIRYRPSIPLRKRAALALQRFRWNKNRYQRARFHKAFEKEAKSDSPLSALYTEKAKELANPKPRTKSEQEDRGILFGALSGAALPAAASVAAGVTGELFTEGAVFTGLFGGLVGGFIGIWPGSLFGSAAFDREHDRRNGILHGKEVLRTQIESSGELAPHLLAYLPERDLIALREATLAHIASLSAKKVLSLEEVDTLTRVHETMTHIDARLNIPSVGSSSRIRPNRS